MWYEIIGLFVVLVLVTWKLIKSLKKTAIDNPYPEILKFCDWFKKQHEENGLVYVNLSLRCPEGMNVPSTDSEFFDPKNFENRFGRLATFTPEMAVALRDYVASCKKTESFDYFEKVCAEFNRIEDLISRVETKQPPVLF